MRGEIEFFFVEKDCFLKGEVVRTIMAEERGLEVS